MEDDIIESSDEQLDNDEINSFEEAFIRGEEKAQIYDGEEDESEEQEEEEDE